jgi:cell division protein ZapA
VAQQNKTRTNVDIYGQQYTVIGDEDTSHVRMVASIVDGKMREINEKNPYLDTNKLAVLTAVNTVNEYLKLKREYDILLQKLQKEEGKMDND